MKKVNALALLAGVLLAVAVIALTLRQTGGGGSGEKFSSDSDLNVLGPSLVHEVMRHHL